MTADRTEPFGSPADDSGGPGFGGRAWRGLTGSIAAGLAVLAVVVAVAAGVAETGGPSTGVIVWHVVGAVVTLGAQARLVDRRQGPVAGLAGIGILALTGVVLWMCWWA